MDNSIGLSMMLIVRAREERRKKEACPKWREAREKALEAWKIRDDLRKAIKGIGRNEKCPTHGIKLKKCGCLLKAREKIEFDGTEY